MMAVITTNINFSDNNNFYLKRKIGRGNLSWAGKWDEGTRAYLNPIFKLFPVPGTSGAHGRVIQKQHYHLEARQRGGSHWVGYISSRCSHSRTILRALSYSFRISIISSPKSPSLVVPGGETAQQLRAPALLEDPGSILSSHKAAHSCL